MSTLYSVQCTGWFICLAEKTQTTASVYHNVFDRLDRIFQTSLYNTKFFSVQFMSCKGFSDFHVLYIIIFITCKCIPSPFRSVSMC